MESSILTSVKNFLGLAAEYTAFDEDITMSINSVFGILQDLGIGPVDGFFIEDESASWDDYVTPSVPFAHSIKILVCLRVQLIFDSNTATSFVIAARERQIAELEWRVNARREEILYPATEAS